MGAIDNLNNKINGLFHKKPSQEDKDPQKDSSVSDDNRTEVQNGDGSSKKKKSELVKVLDESVWESVNEDFKANKQFIISENNEQLYVALLFDTNEIGGLAGKSIRKDESKGSIIEAIRTGRIKTYIRPEMLMEDCFVIIPTKETIENMDEFRMLIDTNYVLCTVSKMGTITTMTYNNTDNEIKVTYREVADLIASGKDVHELFSAKGTNSGMFNNATDSKQDDAPEQEDPEQEEVPLEQLPVIDANTYDPSDDYDTEPDLNEQPVRSVQSDPVIVQPVPARTQPMPPVQTQPRPVQQNQDDEQFDFGPPESDDGSDYYEDDYEDVTEEAVRDFTTRTFYSDDLGLEVSTQPFDVQFMHGNSYLPFNEHRGPGWLNEQLSNLSKDGNTRMERLHSENIYRLREKYMRLIQTQCEMIAKKLDINDSSNTYGQMKLSIETHRENCLNDIDNAVRPKTEQLEAVWKQTLESVGEKAKTDAITQYISRYGNTHQEDLLNLKAREKDEIERDYQNALKRMNEERRNEATKLLDIAINKTLKELSDIYLKVLLEEKKEYVRIQNQMTRFIDDNRKNEVARIAALEEENKQNNKAEEVRKEYVSKIRAMAADFDTKTAELQTDVNRLRINHDNEIRRLESEWSDKLNDEKNKTATVQRQLDELLTKYADLEQSKNAEYEERFERLKKDNEAYKNELEHVAEVHKRSNKMTICLTIAAIIAFLGIGFMIGSVVNLRRASVMEQEALSKVSQSVTESVVSEVSTSSESTTTDGSETTSFTEPSAPPVSSQESSSAGSSVTSQTNSQNSFVNTESSVNMTSAASAEESKIESSRVTSNNVSSSASDDTSRSSSNSSSSTSSVVPRF